MNIGLVVGKFYPFHLGHAFLIQRALDECDHVVVFAMGNDAESFTPWRRVDWIEDHFGIHLYGRLFVFPVVDNEPVDYSSREADLAHAKIIADNLHGFRPNRVYSSEDYGVRLAADLSDILGCQMEHRLVDQAREVVPVSATKIRNEPYLYWYFLPEAVKADLCKRVVICGAESTGTTTLAKDLANHLETVVVPEMGRHYDWSMGPHHTWDTHDFSIIAREQKRWEDMLARKSGPVLICDTDEYATAMFHEVYLGEPSPALLHVAEHTPADLYIVTSDVGVPFEDDGTRFNSGRRPWMTSWFWDTLPGPNKAIAFGSREDRLKSALDLIMDLKWDLYEPVELGKAAP